MRAEIGPHQLLRATAWFFAALLLTMLYAGCEQQPEQVREAQDRTERDVEEKSLEEVKPVPEAVQKVVTKYAGADSKITSIVQTPDGWEVIVWRVVGYDDEGNPQFVPGGHNVMFVNEDGTLSHIIGGR